MTGRQMQEDGGLAHGTHGTHGRIFTGGNGENGGRAGGGQRIGREEAQKAQKTEGGLCHRAHGARTQRKQEDGRRIEKLKPGNERQSAETDGGRVAAKKRKRRKIRRNLRSLQASDRLL